ncbi:MAG TPA: PRC-barrel domain-containing protein [Bradyrhizobium sp.]|nr:PRC-barrel domain-containing protein [Bradyrhizobium sp.]
MPLTKVRAYTILSEFEQAQAEIIGQAVVLTDGKAGTVERVWLDEFHGLRISIRGHDGKWPISTIKFAQTGPVRTSVATRA